MLVEPGVNAHVIGSHLLLGELLDLLDSPGSAVLEADAVKPLVQVDGVLAGHHLAHGRAFGLLLTLRGHLGSRLQVGKLELGMFYYTFIQTSIKELGLS